MSKHTPEPWTTERNNGIYLTLPNGDTHLFPIIWSKKAGMDVAYIVPMDDTKHADADRIVACVNALAGKNPEAVPDVVAALRAVNALHPRNIPSNLDEYLQFWDAIDLSHTALAKLEQV